MKQAIFTVLAAVAGFIGKSLWDLYWKRHEQVEALARQTRIEFMERQLSQFYWPLYLRLQENNVIWEHLMHGEAVDQAVKQQVDVQLYKTFFLPNHDSMIKTIESNVHLAQPDREFEDLLLRFIRHATIYGTMRGAGLEYDPVAVGEPWPAGFFPAVESRLRALQQEYNREVRRKTVEA